MTSPVLAPHGTAASARRVLELGCGRRRTVPGAVTVDLRAEAGPDVVHDLDVTPWPFPDSSFDEIHMRHVIEHMEDVVATMEELHRVGRHGARVHVLTPHYSSTNSYTDPTHRHHLGLRSFDYFTGEAEFDFYTTARFRCVRKELHFNPWPLSPLVRLLARRFPRYYEDRLCWIHPALSLEVELEVVKPGSVTGR